MKKTIGIIAVAFLALFFFGFSGKLWENVDAGEIVVVQHPVSGELSWSTQPGMIWQGLGKVTRYQKRSQFWFSNKKDQGQDSDQSIRVRFNDAGHASISGSISWEMPNDSRHLTMLHTRYGSQEAIEHQLIRPVVEKAVYMTGPLMSSKESYAERRNDLLQLIEDQVQNGPFKTKTVPVHAPDPITNEDKIINVVQLVQQGGNIVRTAGSPLGEFGIRTYNPSINEVRYDETVEHQIQDQQKLTMQVQTAIAEARQAEQRAVTVAKEGEANAAKARWEQEVEKAKVVTKAEQELRVAELATATAEQYRQAQLKRADGDATYKRQVMAADGALQQKLAAWVDVNHAYAAAIQNHEGSWVPSVVMGQGQGQANGATPLIDMLTIKTARDLGLDMSIKQGGNNDH